MIADFGEALNVAISVVMESRTMMLWEVSTVTSLRGGHKYEHDFQVQPVLLGPLPE